MANYNCEACEDLRQTDPNMIVNGFGDEECASLQNDTGLVPSSGHNDCEDLNNLNDCLVGNMETEVEAYDVCDWKTFMKKFIPNVWTTIKGIICAICGIWTNIHNIWDKIAEILKNIDKLFCILNKMNGGITFNIGESPTAGSYVVAGKGVSFLAADDSPQGYSANIHMDYIAGGLIIGAGSCNFHTTNFTDRGACVNFDNGTNERTSSARLGNNIWGKSNHRPASAGELIYEIRILKSQYPQVGQLFNGNGQMTNGGAYLVSAIVFPEGQYAYGQHGNCNIQNGQPAKSGYSGGHYVPAGWVYVQIRMQHLISPMTNGSQYSPRYIMGMRPNVLDFDC